jgi:type III secretory pathway component EscU
MKSKKVPENLLYLYLIPFLVLNTLHNWLIMSLVFLEFPKEFLTTSRLKRLKKSKDPKKRELADMLGGFLNRQDRGHY